MAYFKRVQSYENLKQQFRKLVKQHHPDLTGSDDKAIKQINAEYEALFNIWKFKDKVNNNETVDSVRSEFYTQNGWKGSKYSTYLDTGEIARRLRAFVRAVFPTWKFSITTEYYSGGSSLYISIMEAPCNIFNPNYYSEYLTEELSAEGIENGKCYIQLNPHKVDEKLFTAEGRRVVGTVMDEVNSYRYDDSDAMIDYFSTNFYPHFRIGKWDRGFKIVPKTVKKQKNKMVAV